MKRLALLSLIVASSALGCASLDAGYVAADRATHDAFAPVVKRDARQDSKDAYDGWTFRLESAERRLSTAQPAK